MNPTNLHDVLRPGMTRHQAEDALRNHGWSYLSSGYYSSVYEHRATSHVVKVGDTYADGYLAYALWCAANKGTKHLPVIHNIYESGDGRWYAVEMRRYESIKNEDSYYSAKTKAMQEQWTMACCFLPRKTSRDIEYSTKPLDPQAMIDMGHTMRSMIAFFGSVCEWDFHSGNAMWCHRTNTLIITDPLHEMRRGDLDDRLRSLHRTRDSMKHKSQPELDPARMHEPVMRKAHPPVWNDRLMQFEVPHLEPSMHEVRAVAMKDDRMMMHLARDLAKIQPGGIQRRPIVERGFRPLPIDFAKLEEAFVGLAQAAAPRMQPKQLVVDKPHGSMSFMRNIAVRKPGLPNRNMMFYRLAQQALAKDERFL
ncbi:protein kinase [Pseudomonas phage vB_PpuP-Kurepalu-1]